MDGQAVTLPAPRFVEVGPRDGLQNEKAVVPLAAKVAYIDALSATGLREIEAGAFVSPKSVPQMADSDQVFARITRRPGVVYSALVPNEQGFERALMAGVNKISVFTAASESFNQKNINASIAESIERFKPVVFLAKKAKLPVRAYVSTAIYCPYEGAIKPEAVIDVVKRLQDISVDEISVGDTTGKASAVDVRRVLGPLLGVISSARVFLHFHDTFGHAVENALVAWREYGVSGFDASTGGVGGCPYAPGASGNVAMEDLVVAFTAAGATTGVDLNGLKVAAEGLAQHLGRPLGARKNK